MWFRVHSNAVKMLERRVVIESCDIFLYPSGSEFAEAVGVPVSDDALTISVSTRNLAVHFCTSSAAVGVPLLEAIARGAASRGAREFLLVTRRGLTSSAGSSLSHVFGAEVRVQTLACSKLVVDIMAHANMPRVRPPAESLLTCATTASGGLHAGGSASNASARSRMSSFHRSPPASNLACEKSWSLNEGGASSSSPATSRLSGQSAPCENPWFLPSHTRKESMSMAVAAHQTSSHYEYCSPS